MSLALKACPKGFSHFVLLSPSSLPTANPHCLSAHFASLPARDKVLLSSRVSRLPAPLEAFVAPPSSAQPHLVPVFDAETSRRIAPDVLLPLSSASSSALSLKKDKKPSADVKPAQNRGHSAQKLAFLMKELKTKHDPPQAQLPIQPSFDNGHANNSRRVPALLDRLKLSRILTASRDGTRSWEVQSSELPGFPQSAISAAEFPWRRGGDLMAVRREYLDVFLHSPNARAVRMYLADASFTADFYFTTILQLEGVLPLDGLPISDALSPALSPKAFECQSFDFNDPRRCQFTIRKFHASDAASPFVVSSSSSSSLSTQWPFLSHVQPFGYLAREIIQSLQLHRDDASYSTIDLFNHLKNQSESFQYPPMQHPRNHQLLPSIPNPRQSLLAFYHRLLINDQKARKHASRNDWSHQVSIRVSEVSEYVHKVFQELKKIN